MHLIKIHKFGPIADCIMDVKKFTVLTGPQAEGKSTIAKAIYYFSISTTSYIIFNR